MIWRFFNNRTGQHCEAIGMSALTATNGACLRSATPP
jgi:hypothetical protein